MMRVALSSRPLCGLAVIPIEVPMNRIDVKFLDHTMICTENMLKERSIGIGDEM